MAQQRSSRLPEQLRMAAMMLMVVVGVSHAWTSFVRPATRHALVRVQRQHDQQQQRDTTTAASSGLNPGLWLSRPSSISSPSSTTTTTAPASPVEPGCVVTVLCQLVPEGDFIPEPLFDGIVLPKQQQQPDCIATATGADDGRRQLRPSPCDSVQHPMDADAAAARSANEKDMDRNDNYTNENAASDWERSAATLQFILQGGNYLPGLHDLILQELHQCGDVVYNVSLDAGWGAHNPDLVVTIDLQSSGLGAQRDMLKPGVTLVLSNGLECAVTTITDQTVTVDANPPLAGASYAATVRLIQAEPGPVIAPYTDDVAVLEQHAATSHYRIATLALGCFWGAELALMREPGVVGTAVGYSQGTIETPSYDQVCTGTTGHTECVLVVYNPAIVTYERLVQLAMDRLGESKYVRNQVGNDRGTQYRHGVYYHTPAQRIIAERIVSSYGPDCVTEVLPATQFWKERDDYHQQYLLKGGQSARKGDSSVIRCYG